MGGEVASARADERMQFTDTEAAPVAVDGCGPAPAIEARALRSYEARKIPSHGARPVAAGIRFAIAQEAARGTIFLWLPVLLGSGALIYFALPVEPPAYALASGLALCVLAAHLAGAKARLRLALLAGLVVLLGLVAAKVETWRASTPMVGSDITTGITGRVLKVEHRADGRFRLTIDILSTARPQLRYAPERARLSARTIPPDLKPGEGLSGLVRLMSPSGPVRPHAYDFSFESYFDRLGAVGFFMREPARIALDHPVGLLQRLAARLQAVREALAGRLREKIGGAEGNVAAALITGLRSGIPEEVNEDLRRAGLAHVLAISGLHMALAAFTIIGAARLGFALFPGFSSRHPVRKYAAGAALMVCFLYLFISGAGVAAQRSFLMLAVMLLALLFDRAALTMRNLAIAALVVIAVSPHEVVGPGFQMSFAATAALIAGYAAWNRRRERAFGRNSAGIEPSGARRLFRLVLVYVGGLALTSLIAGVATTLYGIWHFQRASPLALGANLAAMPVVSLVVMPSAVAAMATMPLNLDGWALALMGRGISTVMAIAHWFSERTPFDATGAIPLSATLSLSCALAILTLTTTRLWLAAVPFLLAGGVLLANHDLPDMFVSEDARLVAVQIGDDTLAVNRARPNGFSIENWLRAAGAGTVRKPAGSKGASLADLLADQSVGRFLCNQSICVLRHPEGMRIAHVKKSDDAATVRRSIIALCASVDLVVVNDPTLDRHCSEDGARIITARDLARRGSAEVRFSEGAGMPHIAFAIREPYRPWHEHRQYSRASRGLGPYGRKDKE
ncbi:ComEC/Rec2 family competence protein [uncultured Nitratireductor sp.]|uniref:ComEC/Rec2 family competence protein n=1 Tax=uncultured Nitratireductor sp. TaxID=520953 RepID=UPI00260179D9|nr:ComEC/Rec2 family competence protein [uncultured Nitratireductor sp.]